MKFILPLYVLFIHVKFKKPSLLPTPPITGLTPPALPPFLHSTAKAAFPGAAGQSFS